MNNCTDFLFFLHQLPGGMVLSIFMVAHAVLAEALLAPPKCTANPGCVPGGPGPHDPEPGCKACVAPATNYNCALCCPNCEVHRPRQVGPETLI